MMISTSAITGMDMRNAGYIVSIAETPYPEEMIRFCALPAGSSIDPEYAAADTSAADALAYLSFSVFSSTLSEMAVNAIAE